MGKAASHPQTMVVVRFGPLRDREVLVELCAALKRNEHIVLALLDSKHRQLVETLERVRVDFVRFVGNVELTSDQLLKVGAQLGPVDRPRSQLAALCPFLHYDPLDVQHELVTCGAYLDRMVLGGRRLRTICETENHLLCEYYLVPRCSA